MRAGVLALQGAFREHRRHLEALGAEVTEVRLPADLAGLGALVLPGGESTTMRNLLTSTGLTQPLRDFYAGGGALWGSCAGAILLAREVGGVTLEDSLNLMDTAVERNAYGRQVASFEADLQVAGLPGGPLPVMFIRAPRIVRVGPAAEVLAEHAGEPCLVREGRLLASTFHPELGHDSRLHQFFLEMVRQKK
ncbi:pyridoxal 5'-phosphate synthase glutaminase subunit PdxT [Deinococcus lacus]|uniref:Pyridoxal 5'-phosphate synthase subunit PdxT n=1 Tax=Deinococcus lacus TaxID=392561 RepID=A0ABW1YBV4_9DEIO